MINKYSLLYTVLLLTQSSYTVRDLRELKKRSLKANKNIVETNRFLKTVEENLFRELLAMRVRDLPNFAVNKEFKSFKSLSNQYLIIAVDPSMSTFLRYRNDGERYDPKLLKTVREQWGRGVSLKKVNVTVFDNWARASFPIMINARDLSLDIVKARVATMVQWCGQFCYAIPKDRIFLKDHRSNVFFNITRDDQLKKQKYKSLCALIDMENFKKPENKSE